MACQHEKTDALFKTIDHEQNGDDIVLTQRCELCMTMRTKNEKVVRPVEDKTAAKRMK